MFDELLQSMVFGKKVMYNDEEYQIVHALEGNYYLAIKCEQELPAQTYVIKINKLD